MDGNLAGPGEDTLLFHFAWTIWHEGVRIYVDGIQEAFRDINDIRNESLAYQEHNPHAHNLIRTASNNDLISLLPVINEKVYIQFTLPVHLSWLAYHEGQLDAFRTALSKGNFENIRGIYYGKQEHNPNAKYLLAAMSDFDLVQLVNGL